jgi:hypothetical protein
MWGFVTFLAAFWVQTVGDSHILSSLLKECGALGGDSFCKFQDGGHFSCNDFWVIQDGGHCSRSQI